MQPKAGTILQRCRWKAGETGQEAVVNNIIYIIGLIVVVLAILSFFGLR